MNQSTKIKEIPKIVIVGHVDHGKSSLIGRLMYDLDQVPDGKYEELKKVSKKRGMEFEFAFLLDALQAERDQGITIDTTQIFFKTKKRNYIFIDAPGHKEFIKNMITGAASADIAILIVDVDEGIKAQTKKHAYILKLLGIKKVITLFNKMDKINYDEGKYLFVKKQLEEYLNKINVEPLNNIPISAKIGDNIVTKSKKIIWYRGDTLTNVLDNYEYSEEKNEHFLRLPVQDIYKFSDKRVIVGRVESGKINIGDELLILPSNEKVKIKSFEEWPKPKKEYYTGECLGLTLSDEIFVDKGNIISHPKNPPKLMNTFEATLFWLVNKRIDLKRKYQLKINTGEYSVNIRKVHKTIDTENLESKANKKLPSKNDVCEVVMHSSQLIPMDDFNTLTKTARFCLLDENEIIAGGIASLQNYPDQKELSNNPNIRPFSFNVTEVDRASRFNHRSGVIWMTGLSGAGKSSIAKETERKLFLKGFNVFILDGDNLRMGLNKGLTFSPEDRTENIRRTAEVAKLFTDAGFIVIVSLISPYRSERKKARDLRPEYFREIYIKASLEECIKRDVKGMYAKAMRSEIKDFTGISSPYEEPISPDLTIETEKEKIEDSVLKLENFITNEFSIKK
ncbi:MAG: adenylyl-sulfate kinase [Alphaproteobacteria bacterium]|nr:adenylyl-sulfate kinase [Alphaproteobacteria bacterium]